MSRIINTEGVGKERNRLVRSIVAAMRLLIRQSEPDQHSRDLAAYIALALLEISRTIEPSVAAWEKKGYWVKADRFRMEWIWTERTGNQLEEAVIQDDWAAIAMLIAQVGAKFNNVEISSRHRFGEPWVGAYEQLKTQAK